MASPSRELRLRVSLFGDIAPARGVVDPPFLWVDVLDGEPPGDDERGPPVYCLPAEETLAGSVRIEDVLLVSVREEGIEVEDRICATTRMLAASIEAERRVVGEALEPLRARREETATRLSEEAEEQAGPRAPLLKMAALGHRGAAAVLGGARRVTRGIATTPDRLRTHVIRASALLSTSQGRERFRVGLTQPSLLHGDEKAVVLFVCLSGLAVLLALAHTGVTLVAPDFARPWRAALLLFVYGILASFGFPLPIEPALVPAALAVGGVAAVLVTVCAKVIAAWLVFFVGDEVNDAATRASESRPRLRRLLAFAERYAQRWGFLTVLVLIAVPGLPDFIALYLFATLRMELWKFLTAVAIGSAFLNSLIVFGVLHLLGL